MPDTAALELARALVRLDTRAGGERAAAELLADRLDAGGFTVHVDEPEPGRANLVAQLGTGGFAPVTLTGHLDTVPADDASWTFDPLAADVVDGRLRGRGTSDMKAGVAVQVDAALAHAARPGTPTRPTSPTRPARSRCSTTPRRPTGGCSASRRRTDRSPEGRTLSGHGARAGPARRRPRGRRPRAGRRR